MVTAKIFVTMIMRLKKKANPCDIYFVSGVWPGCQGDVSGRRRVCEKRDAHTWLGSEDLWTLDSWIDGNIFKTWWKTSDNMIGSEFAVVDDRADARHLAAEKADEEELVQGLQAGSWEEQQEELRKN